MSGIAGIIHFDGAPVEPGLIEKMTSAMSRRGPDGIHHWIRGNVALGQCMLRTTPESLEERQPLANEDEGLVLVMDGRVDNWEELRRELLDRGAHLRDRSDAELVLRSYETWGEDCLAHIDGDFAFVIWEARRRTAFCGRDRMGNKPFTYHWDRETLSFASDMHAIMVLPWVPRRINEGMLAEHLAAEWHSRTETIWTGIHRLAPASTLRAGGGPSRVLRYWLPDVFAGRAGKEDEEFVEEYKELVFDSVRRASRSCGPIAVQVSGGLDSSAVLSIAEDLRRTGRLRAPALRAYTFTFSDDGPANEIVHARSCAEHLGVRIREVERSLPSAEEYAERAQAFQDFPGYPNGLMCSGLMRQASSEGARVILTGQGGDHWLQGTRSYYAEELAAGRWPTLLRCLREDSAEAGSVRTLGWFLRYGVYPQLPAWLRSTLRRWWWQERGASGREIYWLAQRPRSLLVQRRQKDDTLGGLKPACAGQRSLLEALGDPLMSHVVERFEREAARLAVELRHPYWSRRLVEFAFSTPERLRLRGGVSKYIHVRAMTGVMSPSVLARRDKAEFSSVFHVHLRRLHDALTVDIPNRRPGWLAPGGVERLYREYEEDPTSGWRLWALWGIYASDMVLPFGTE